MAKFSPGEIIPCEIVPGRNSPPPPYCVRLCQNHFNGKDTLTGRLERSAHTVQLQAGGGILERAKFGMAIFTGGLRSGGVAFSALRICTIVPAQFALQVSNNRKRQGWREQQWREPLADSLGLFGQQQQPSRSPQKLQQPTRKVSSLVGKRVGCVKVTHARNHFYEFFPATCARYDLLQHTLGMWTLLTR